MDNAVKDSTILEKGNDRKKALSKFTDCYKDSLLDNEASNETKCKKMKKKEIKSPSVETVYEGKKR